MQRRHVNGTSYPTSFTHSKPAKKTKGFGSHKNRTLAQTNSTENDLEVYDDEDLDIAPYVVRKDRLILELESSLAEMDDQCMSASRLEEQKTAAEEQRNVLMREIEVTVSEIQGHVLNAREMEIEKKAIENECKGLKTQVEHLRALLDDKEGKKQWNHVDIMDGDDSLRASLAHANSRNQLLEKEVKKLRLANERMHLKEKSRKGSVDAEKLRKENEELQKLIQAAEESENNIAQELATCHQTMARMKQDYEQLNQDKLHIEAEKNTLALEKAELETELKKLLDSQDKQNAKTVQKASGVPSSRLEKEKMILQKKLQKNEDEREELENQNSEQKKQIEELRGEIKGLRLQGENAEKGELNPSEQLRPALEKLNKENSQLHLELEKAEKEINALKICLEEERTTKNSEDVAVEKNEKFKTEKPKKGKAAKNKESAKKSKKNSSKEEKKNDENDEDIESLKDEIETLKKHKSHMESECQALSETVTKIAGEKRAMRKEIEDLTNEKEKLERKAKDLEFRIRELEIIKARKEELDKNHAELQTRHQEVSSELEKTNENNAMVHNQLEKTTAEKDTLLTERQEFQEALEAIKKEMEGVRKDVASKSNEIKLLRKKHEEEKRRLIGMKDGGDKEMNRLQNKLKGIWEKLGLETEPEPSDAEVKTIIKKLQSDVEELKRENEELGKLKKEIEEKLEGLEKKSDELLVESAKANDMAMEKAVELSRTKRAYEKKIEKLNKENSELRKKIGELSPATSVSPRISPEPIQAQNAQSVESEYPGPSSAQPRPVQPPQASYQGSSGLRNHPHESKRPPPYTGRGHGLPIEPPPYPMTKRKSMDDVVLRGQQNDRYLPPYPGRPRRTSETSNQAPSRPQSGSVVTVVAGSVGDRQDVRRSNANYSSFPKERRRSHGGQTYPHRSSEAGYRSEPQSPTEQDTTFQVVGYRKVIQEHYV